MDIHVARWGFGQDSSVGRFSINDTRRCWSLEDEGRNRKVQNETRIPAGRYRVTLRRVGGFHTRYADRFPDMHGGMLWIRDVPGFEYILIHCGNDDDDTAGCVLVGRTHHTKLQDDWVEFTVGSSVAAYKDIYPEIAATLLADEEVWITIQDFTMVDAE